MRHWTNSDGNSLSLFGLIIGLIFVNINKKKKALSCLLYGVSGLSGKSELSRKGLKSCEWVAVQDLIEVEINYCKGLATNLDGN